MSVAAQSEHQPDVFQAGVQFDQLIAQIHKRLKVGDVARTGFVHEHMVFTTPAGVNPADQRGGGAEASKGYSDGNPSGRPVTWRGGTPWLLSLDPRLGQLLPTIDSLIARRTGLVVRAGRSLPGAATHCGG